MRKAGTVAIVALVFISEALALGSFMIWGFAKSDHWALPLALLITMVVIWREVISPGGRFIGAVTTPTALALMYGVAVVAVWDPGHHTLAMIQAVVFVAASHDFHTVNQVPVELQGFKVE